MTAAMKGQRVLIVGHGPIGHSFIEKLLDRQAGCEISVLCEEPRPAYNRVMLTQYFLDLDGDKHDGMKLSYITEKQLQTSGVKIIYGRAIAVDRESSTVTYAKSTDPSVQTVVAYDFLVLATGSFCFVPPVPGMTIPEKRNPSWPDDPASRPAGVFVYRTIEDLEGLLQAAKNGAKRAAVIGGGLLGLEAAKAVFDLNMESHVLEMAPYLMPTQLNEAAGKVLTRKIEALGIKVHAGVQIKEVLLEDGRTVGLRIVEHGATEATVLDVDIVVVSCGVRPRDELAKQCGLELGARGGVKVDSSLFSSDPKICAIGEVAAIGGSLCYGLWAPGVEQAEALVRNLVDGKGTVEYSGSDLSTKLKLLGVDVASFGRDLDFWFKRQFDGKDQNVQAVECVNNLSGSYRRLCFSADGTKLMGGILVGDAKDYSKLLQLCKKDDLGGQDPEGLTFKRPLAGPTQSNDGGDGTGMADDDLICTCLGLSKAQVRSAIVDQEAYSVPLIKKCCKAGTGCGGCVSPVGEVPKLLAHTLKSIGKAGVVGICAHFPYSRQELFDIIRVKKLKSFSEALQSVGKGNTQDGCELCKPVMASILSGLWNEHILADGRDQIQDTNDRFLANIQKTGTYSVIPRCPGGDIAPDELIAIGTTAKKFGLWTKITGAQRLAMFGAPANQLPSIFKDLVDAGLESGQAYGKALRTVKSCVGSTWCRYGQQDSVTMAVTLENRYKGIRSPHKLKMAVSGCLRECAEAQGKDVGLIATQVGYNLYVGGNGGARPVHAQLLATDISEETCLKYIDRFLMFYITTAKHLQRTAPWMRELPGGIEYLKKVIIEDSLGVCADLEALLAQNMEKYKCEWKEVAYDEDMQKKFQQFVNTKETQNSEQIGYVNMRKQRHPDPISPPDITGPALYNKETAPQDWDWVFAGIVNDFPRNGGLAVKHGQGEIAVFHLPGQAPADRWMAVQNMCPHKQAQTMSRGLLGEVPAGLTICDPIYKTVYDLRTGKGITNASLNLSTFAVRIDEDGRVLVKLPPPELMYEAFQTQVAQAYETAGMSGYLKNPQDSNGAAPPASGTSSKPFVPAPRKTEGALDW